jgi:hypothetical protein
MSIFHSLLNKAYREIITEQDQPELKTDIALQAPDVVQPDQAALTPAPEVSEPEAGEKEAMSPEGMVFLVRLIKKALMIEELEPDEEKIIAELGNIDEINAKNAIEKLMPIIQKYAPSVERLPEVA